MSVHKDERRGTWYFTLRPPGHRHATKRRGFRLQRDAQKAEREFLAATDVGDYDVVIEASTVGAFLTGVWLPFIEGRKEEGTIDNYKRLSRLYLVPHIGSIDLDTLVTAHVDLMISKILKAGKSPKYTRNIHGVLSAALNDALRWGMVKTNVAHGAALPVLPLVAPKAWTMAQLASFTAAIGDERLRYIWTFIAQTGCRRSDACGVRWSDIDLDAGRVTFAHARVIVGGRAITKSPKTAAGARTVCIDPGLVAMLRQCRTEQLLEFLALGIRPSHDYCFTGEDGAPYWPQRVTAAFTKLVRELDLPRITVHGLRHTAATWAISNGFNPKVVAQRLGHRDASFTIKRYSHVLPGHDEEVAAAYAAALDVASGCHVAATEASSST
jgi:integrase